MADSRPAKIEDWVTNGRKRELELILAAGFEKRSKAVIQRLTRVSGFRFRKAIILDYGNKDLNEPTRSEIIAMAKTNFDRCKVIPVSQLEAVVRETEDGQQEFSRLVDISGMSRVLIFQLLHRLIIGGVRFDVAYTEAEDYYPNRGFYEKLKEKKVKDADFFFDALDELVEKKEIIYSYNCELVQPVEFRGKVEPGLPSVLIGFLAFKRSRIQALLSSYEFSVRIFVLSRPVRSEIDWRADLMRIINADVLKRRPSKILDLETLNPLACLASLERELKENPDCHKANIYLAPLGSKMQTLGSYLFWRSHPDISVVFSQPYEYFSDSFSEGWRDTFIITYENLDFLAGSR